MLYSGKQEAYLFVHLPLCIDPGYIRKRTVCCLKRFKADDQPMEKLFRSLFLTGLRIFF